MKKKLILYLVCFSLALLAGERNVPSNELEELILSYKSAGIVISKEEYCQDYLGYASQREYFHCSLASEPDDCHAYVIRMLKLCLEVQGLEPRDENVKGVLAKFLNEDLFCEFLQKKIKEVNSESDNDAINLLKSQFEITMKKKVNCAK